MFFICYLRNINITRKKPWQNGQFNTTPIQWIAEIHAELSKLGNKPIIKEITFYYSGDFIYGCFFEL